MTPAAEEGGGFEEAAEAEAAAAAASEGGLSAEEIAANLVRLKKAGRGGRGGRGGRAGREREGKEKEARSWDGGPAPAKLDFSSDKGAGARAAVKVYEGGRVDLDQAFGVGAAPPAEGTTSFLGGAAEPAGRGGAT